VKTTFEFIQEDQYLI